MSKLESFNQPAAAYLKAIPGGDSSWALYKSIASNVSLFGHRTSNIIESENSRYLPLRSLSPLKFVHETSRHWMSQNNKSAEKLAKFKNKGLLLTKAIADKNAKLETLTGNYSVEKINGTSAFVKSMVNNPQDKERKVEFKTEQGVCSCGLWVQLKCPCVHAIAANNALKFKNTVESWYQYAFAPAYLLKSYELAFGETNPGIVPPLIGDLLPEEISLNWFHLSISTFRSLS